MGLQGGCDCEGPGGSWHSLKLKGCWGFSEAAGTFSEVTGRAYEVTGKISEADWRAPVAAGRVWGGMNSEKKISCVVVLKVIILYGADPQKTRNKKK